MKIKLKAELQIFGTVDESQTSNFYVQYISGSVFRNKKYPSKVDLLYELEGLNFEANIWPQWESFELGACIIPANETIKESYSFTRCLNHENFSGEIIGKIGVFRTQQFSEPVILIFDNKRPVSDIF